MKSSIGRKLFIYVFAIIFSLIGILYILNETVLPTFYLQSKKHVLVEQAEKIVAYQSAGYDLHYNDIERIGRNQGTEIAIYNGDDVLYEPYMDNDKDSLIGSKEATNSGVDENKNKKSPKVKWWQRSQNMDITAEGAFSTEIDPATHVESIIYKQLLNNGDVVAIRIAVGAIEDSIRITNTFLLIVSLIFIAIASILTYILSKKFTNPIIQMQQITQKMSDLKFDEYCDVKSKDELGILSENINTLSNRLATALSELQEKNEKLVIELAKERQLDTMRRSFVSNVSHELRTPLSIVESYAEGLSLNVASDEKSRTEYCEIIIEEITHMTNLIDTILDLSQIETGVLKLRLTRINPVDEIQKIVQLYQVFAEQKGGKIIAQYDEDGAYMIETDHIRFQQILRNYMTNALTHAVDGTNIMIHQFIENDKVRIEISNEGVKLTTAEMKNIWNEFYKKDTDRNRDQKQYGLGLSIVKGIVMLHKRAEYGVYQTDKGMCFWIAFPLSSQK